MSNQRKGKYQSKDTSHNDMKIYKSLKLASQVLKDAGYEDPSFYFEQEQIICQVTNLNYRKTKI